MSNPIRIRAVDGRPRTAGRRRVRAAVALALAGVLVGGPALADDLDDIRERIREVERQESRAANDRGAAEQAASSLGVELDHTSAELVEADARLSETTARVEAARVALGEAEADVAAAEAETDRIESDLALARADEASIQEALGANAAEQEESRATVGAIARDSYKQGGLGSLATTLELLAGESDAVDRMAMARTVIRVQDQQIRTLATQEAQAVAEQDRLAGVRQDIAYLLAEAEANVVATEQARAAAVQATTDLEALEAQQAQDRAALEAEKARVQAELDVEQQRSDELTAQLQELASTKHGLVDAEEAELDRIAAEEARRRAEAERRRAAEEAAARAAAEDAAARAAAEEAAARAAAEEAAARAAEEEAAARAAAEKARRQAEEAARRQAAEEAAAREAAEEADRQRAAEREAQRQREAAADAQRRREEAASMEAERRAAAAQEEAERRAAAAQAEADRAAEAAREAAARELAERQAAEEQAARDAEREREEAAEASSGYLSYPINAPTTSEFGNRLHPVLGVWLLHSGLDFAAPCGTPVTAAADGVVYGTLYDDSRGNYVVLDHGVQRGVNLTTAYLHLESFAVSGGQSVSRGQVIGYEGTTGTSTGCHLHFETRENGTPVNPRGWL